jgi:hypothetical protein
VRPPRTPRLCIVLRAQVLATIVSVVAGVRGARAGLRDGHSSSCARQRHRHCGEHAGHVAPVKGGRARCAVHSRQDGAAARSSGCWTREQLGSNSAGKSRHENWRRALEWSAECSVIKSASVYRAHRTTRKPNSSPVNTPPSAQESSKVASCDESRPPPRSDIWASCRTA